MSDRDWLVTDEGRCVPLLSESSEVDEAQPYRLYRFLTDVEDIVNREPDNRRRLEQICPLVRRLLGSSDWLLTNFSLPDPHIGWSVQTHYDDPDFPFVVQTVVWSPQSFSSIHNHATWGIVAMLDGQEQNTFWQRSPTSILPDRIEPTESYLLTTGSILCLMPDAIHQTVVVGDEPTISFNVYGTTDYQRRWEFNSELHTAENF
jgi:predicted metal-dependent enzyme (double-stranded beta helix superfamily)